MTGGSAASRGRMEADVEAGEGVWRVTLEMTPFCACAAPGREEDAPSVATLRAFMATAGRKAKRVAALRKLANIVAAKWVSARELHLHVSAALHTAAVVDRQMKEWSWSGRAR